MRGSKAFIQLDPINIPISISSVCVISDLIQCRCFHSDTFSGVVTSSFSTGSVSLYKPLEVKSSHSSWLHRQPSSYLPSGFLLISLKFRLSEFLTILAQRFDSILSDETSQTTVIHHSISPDDLFTILIWNLIGTTHTHWLLEHQTCHLLMHVSHFLLQLYSLWTFRVF